MSNFRLDQAYHVAEPGGIGAGRVVVRTENPRECALPGGANVGNVVGITTGAQPGDGRLVGVRRVGVAEAIAAGAITAGRLVAVADDAGRVAEIPTPQYGFGTIPSNNAVRLEWIHRDISPVAAVAIIEPAGNNSFGFEFADGHLVITPTTADGTITMTAAQLIAAIAGDATLSVYIAAYAVGISNGTGLVPEATVPIANPAALRNPIGIAEGPAYTAGDMVPVMLLPALTGHHA